MICDLLDSDKDKDAYDDVYISISKWLKIFESCLKNVKAKSGNIYNYIYMPTSVMWLMWPTM